MAALTYFLGANTPRGFCSAYDSLFHDPRLNQVLILKGGPGCGKSTLMKALAAHGASLGLRTEQVLCSSDPDSLDALILPDVGLALVDGTAPHVVEPPLCGCGAAYLDLGRFYQDEAAAALRPELEQAKADNASCYPRAYAALGAAGRWIELLRHWMGPLWSRKEADAALEAVLPLLPRSARVPGRSLPAYLTALTPRGVRSCSVPAQTVWAIQDPFRLAGPLMKALQDRLIRAGQCLRVFSDPLCPSEALALWCPELGVAWVRREPIFRLGQNADPVVDLEQSLRAKVKSGEQPHVDSIQRQLEQAVEEAVFWLSRAKAHHDRLEELYRPTVDFAGVTAVAERLILALDRTVSAGGLAPT